MTRAWWLLTVAILTEVVGSVALEASEGFSRPAPTAVVLVAYTVTFVALGLAMKTLPLGVTYAIWAGAGTALTAIAGVVVFGERPGLAQTLGTLLIIAGVATVNLATPGAGTAPRA